MKKTIIICSLLLLVNCSKKTYDKLEINLIKVTSYGLEDGEPDEIFGGVRDIFVDKQLNVYGNDFVFKKIKKYSNDGRLIKVFGNGEGEGPGEFLLGRDICVDDEFNLYVLDLQLHRVTVFDSSANIIKLVNLNYRPASIAAINLENVFILPSFNSGFDELIFKYDYTLEGKEEPNLKFGRKYTGDYELEIYNSYLYGKVMVKDSVIYYTSGYPYSIQLYNVDGVLLSEFVREVEFFRPPYLKRKSTRYIRNLSGSLQGAILSDTLFINYLFDVDEDGGLISQYFDFWSLNTGKYIGTSKLEKNKVSLSLVGDKYGNLYSNSSTPHISVSKYEFSFKKREEKNKNE
ncbi:MAG: hypothetical protein K9J12_16385 [Melioribacteraceae bacterium]|nr:hypothetical protein [Melioribacteraceae bacterium]MCF8264914.1 hypothetical protein [Melioribacteraceae bacterium]MCF8430726.1 hypothetical protein [Melioribacteraceae bacterium]